MKRLWIFYVFLCLLSPSEKVELFIFSLSETPVSEDFEYFTGTCMESLSEKTLNFLRVSLSEKTLNIWQFSCLESRFEKTLIFFIFFLVWNPRLKRLWIFYIFMYGISVGKDFEYFHVFLSGFWNTCLKILWIFFTFSLSKKALNISRFHCLRSLPAKILKILNIFLICKSCPNPQLWNFHVFSYLESWSEKTLTFSKFPCLESLSQKTLNISENFLSGNFLCLLFRSLYKKFWFWKPYPGILAWPKTLE